MKCTICGKEFDVKTAKTTERLVMDRFCYYCPHCDSPNLKWKKQ